MLEKNKCKKKKTKDENEKKEITLTLSDWCQHKQIELNSFHILRWPLPSVTKNATKYSSFVYIRYFFIHCWKFRKTWSMTMIAATKKNVLYTHEYKSTEKYVDRFLYRPIKTLWNSSIFSGISFVCPKFQSNIWMGS